METINFLFRIFTFILGASLIFTGVKLAPDWMLVLLTGICCVIASKFDLIKRKVE